jgi:hypothetical protein
MKNSKALLEFNLLKLDKINPIDFKKKNNFYYDNAHLIIDCNPLMSNNCYLDVLQTIKEGRSWNSRTRVSKSGDLLIRNVNKNKKESSKRSLIELKMLKKNPLQIGKKSSCNASPCPIKLELKPFPVMINTPREGDNEINNFTSYDEGHSRNRNLEIGNTYNTLTSATEVEDTNFNEEFSVSPIKTKNNKFLISPQSNFHTIASNINSITPFMYEQKTESTKFSKISTSTVRELNKTTKNFSKIKIINSNFKLDEFSKENNDSKVGDNNSKNDEKIIFDREEARMMKTLGFLHPKNKTMSDYYPQSTYYTLDSYEKTVTDEDTSNQKLLLELAKLKCQIFVKEKMKNGGNIDKRTVKIFNSTLSNNSLDSYDYNLINRTIDPSKKGRDALVDRLEILEGLSNKLPDFKANIEKLRLATANLEKRKLIFNHEGGELGDKLDKINSSSKSKIKLDKLNVKIIQKLALKSLMPSRKSPEKINPSEQGQDAARSKTLIKKIKEEKPLKPKFKKLGDCKVMIIPKIIKNSTLITHQHNFEKTVIRNNAEELINDQRVDIKSKKYFTSISTPKSQPSSKSLNSKVCETLRSKCEKIEINNLRLRNKIKITKKKFSKESMYLNPKSAFIIPNMQ